MNNNVSIENKITVNTVNTNSNTNGINTIPEEWQALGFIQGLLCRSISPERVTIRDARSYCAVLVDDNNRKTLARLYLEGAKKKIELPKIEKVIELQSFSDLKKAKSSLFAALNKIENKALPEPQEAPESNPADDTARALQNAAELAHAHAVADFYEQEPEATPEEPEQPETVAALPEPEPEPQDQQEQPASEEQAEIEPPQFKEEQEQEQAQEPETKQEQQEQESKAQEVNYFDYLNI